MLGYPQRVSGNEENPPLTSTGLLLDLAADIAEHPRSSAARELSRCGKVTLIFGQAVGDNRYAMHTTDIRVVTVRPAEPVKPAYIVEAASL